MENRKRITEEDLLVTEALIAESYGRLKKSVVDTPARALVPLSQIIREHPLEAAATAVGGGIAAYGIARMMAPSRRADGDKKRHGKKKKARRRQDPVMDILSVLLPLAIPYLTGFIEKYTGINSRAQQDSSEE